MSGRRARRRAAVLTRACMTALLLIAVPALALAQAADVDLDSVLDGDVPGLSVHVRGTGGYSGLCMGGDFVNDTGQTITVRVPVGLRLVPPEGMEGVQTMVTAGAEMLVIPPGHSSHQFVAYCSEAHDAGPGGVAGFTNGGYVDAELMRVLRRIAEEGHSRGSQHAVWSVTDGYDISDNPDAQRIAGASGVPAGQAAAGGVAAGATAYGLAQLVRRAGEGGGSELGGEGGYDEPSPPDAEPEETDVEREMAAETDAAEPPDKPPEKKDETLPEKKDEPRKPPRPPAPLRAPDGEVLRWDKDRRRVVIEDGTGLSVEAGRGGGWVGRNARTPVDPFRLKPPEDVDVADGDVSIRRRGDQTDVTVRTGDGTPPVRIYRNEQTDHTQVQRGHLVIGRQGDKTSVSDLVGGKRTGVTYDGSKGDFEVFRDQFRLSRTDGTYRLSETAPDGRKYSAGYNPTTGDARLDVGDRWIVKSGDAYGLSTGDRTLMYDARRRFVGYEFPTNAGKGSLSVGVGIDGQGAVARTQPIRIGNREARLNLDYSRMLRESGGGLETDFSAGLDVGRVSVEWSPGDRPNVRYNWKF